MDALRKVYARAISTPLEGVEAIWHAYDAYENNLNKLTAKKMLADRSPTYMAARSAALRLCELLTSNDLDRQAYAFPPSVCLTVGEAANKFVAWHRWIEWEKSNPMQLPDASPILQQRIQYAYREALAVLRMYPEMWFDYSQWLLKVAKREESKSILKSALEVLPDDLLLNFAYVNMLETEIKAENEDTSSIKASVLLLYEDLVERLVKRVEADPSLSNDLTLVLINQMNYTRRLEGLNAARAVFTRARKLLSIGHQMFLAAASMEYHCNKSAAIAGKIYELGMSRFSSNSEYILEYLRFLIAIGDEANAKALFERAIGQVASDESLEVWRHWLEYNFRYADQATIQFYLVRFKEAFPEHPVASDLSIFSAQYSFDELAAGNERIWTIIQGATESSTDKITKSLVKVPFFIPDIIWEFQRKLPDSAHYNGPHINLDLLLRIVQNVRLIPDVPIATRRQPSRAPTTGSAAQKHQSKRTAKRYRGLDDGEGETPKYSIAHQQQEVRPDDLYAQRRLR